tara:strand:- start:69 stop:506 length:438 start_codon:yes stop_codon:yes gene_type:complete
MSSSENKKSELTNIRETSKENDPYAIFENVADTLWERTELALEKGETARISDDTVSKLMTTALKLYAAKTDGEGRTFRPVLGKYDEIVTPTEALTAVTEVLRALRLGPMEFGLWSRRRPEDYHDTDFEVTSTENTIKQRSTRGEF